MPVVVIPSPSNQANNETANWKTYNNTGYGYSLSIPSEWFTKSSPIEDNNNILDNVCLGITQNECLIFITVLKGSSWEREKNLLGFTIGGETKEIIFTGNSALQREGGVSADMDPVGPTKEIITLFKAGDKVYKIHAYKEIKGKPTFPEVVDKIIDSFKLSP